MNIIEMKFQLPVTLSEDEVKLLLAIKLFEVGRVSLGQAAKIAGFTKRAFIDALGRYGAPIFNYPPEELAWEMADPYPRFGSARGLVTMSGDFDDPLEDFKDYMQ